MNQVRSMWSQPFIKYPHMLAKRHPLDCGHARCFMCHHARKGHPRKYDDFYYEMVGDYEEDGPLS